MTDSERSSPCELSRELSEFLVECEGAGRTMSSAGEALARLESLPAPELVEAMVQLRERLLSLLEVAAASTARIGGHPSQAPESEAGLDQVVGYIRRVIAAGESQSAKSVVVLDLLDRVARLAVNEGEDFPALAQVRRQAVELSEKVGRTAKPDTLTEFVELSGGMHPFHHLMTLVEKLELSPREREESLIEVAFASREVARALGNRRLIVGPPKPSPVESAQPSESPVLVDLAGPSLQTSPTFEDLGRRESLQSRSEEPEAVKEKAVDGPAILPPAAPSLDRARSERVEARGACSSAGGDEERASRGRFSPATGRASFDPPQASVARRSEVVEA